MTTDTGTDVVLAPNWRHVGAFLGLTFSLTWLLDLFIYLHGGLNIPGITTILQVQMLLPAFSAILLGLFFFKESSIYQSQLAGKGRWFYYFFLLLTLLYARAALGRWVTPDQGTSDFEIIIVQVLAFLGVLGLVVLRLTQGQEAMARVWLSWGNWKYYVFFGLAFVAYYILQAVLNGVFGLGGARLDLPAIPPGLSPGFFVFLATVQSVLLGPILGIVIAFGEEYGWRGYLQNELFKMGRVRGVLLLGVIWGVWHWPVILMGYNYPDYPALGLLLMALYTTGLAMVLGYAVLKSGSILLAAYLHALNNQVLAFLAVMGFKPYESAFSFGIGIYGIATLAVVALLVLRDPVWRGRGSSLDVTLVEE